MTVLTINTKAIRMRGALAELAGQFINEGKHDEARRVADAVKDLDTGPAGDNRTLARLYDILTAKMES